MKILKILEKISVVNHDDRKNFTNPARLDAIAELLSETKYQRRNQKGLFHLYARKELNKLPEKVVLLSSHVDTKQPDRREPGILKPYAKEWDAEHLKGTFDNSLTNAIVLKAMLEEKLPENVLVAFTGDEEEDLHGARDVMDFLGRAGKEIYVVALDITGEGYEEGCDFSIENNAWKKDPLREKIVEGADRLGFPWRFASWSADSIPKFIEEKYLEHVAMEGGHYKEAMEDESCEYGETQFAFSLCIPIWDIADEHTDKGVLVRKKSVAHYEKVLCRIAEIMDGEMKIKGYSGAVGCKH